MGEQGLTRTFVSSVQTMTRIFATPLQDVCLHEDPTITPWQHQLQTRAMLELTLRSADSMHVFMHVCICICYICKETSKSCAATCQGTIRTPGTLTEVHLCTAPASAAEGLQDQGPRGPPGRGPDSACRRHHEQRWRPVWSKRACRGRACTVGA